MLRPSAVSGSSGQSGSVAVSHGSPSALAAAAHPNQIGQLNGSVSKGPAQPLFGGRPSAPIWYHRNPSASVGPPTTKLSMPWSSVPRRSPPSPGSERTESPSTAVATMEFTARVGPDGRGEPLVAADGLGGAPEPVADADASGDATGERVGEPAAVGSS